MTDTTTQAVDRMAHRHTMNDDEAATLRALAAERDALATAHAQMQQTLDRLTAERETANARADAAEGEVASYKMAAAECELECKALRTGRDAAIRDKPAPAVTVPTLSAALELVEVMALVAELKTARHILAPMPSDNPVTAQAKRQRLAKIAAVLAPFEGIEP